MQSLLFCPADCGKNFDTAKGLNSHLSQARSCMWYRAFEKSNPAQFLSAPIVQDDGGEELMQRDGEENGTLGLNDEQAGEFLQEMEEDNNVFHFVHLEGDPQVGEAGPGPSTQAHRDCMAERQLGGKARELNDGDLPMVEVEHLTGGALIRMDQSLHDRWRLAHNLPVDDPMDGSNSAPDNLYAPFLSEMDWRIADWVVKENIGHNSFNRLLLIPGVCMQLDFSGTF